MMLNLILLGGALPRDTINSPLIPALDTPLFSLHIIFSFIGYAFFARAFSIGVLYLCQKRLDSKCCLTCPLYTASMKKPFFWDRSVYPLRDRWQHMYLL